MNTKLIYLSIGIVLFVVVVIYFRNKMKMPVSGTITSPFGERVHPITGTKSFHNGVDIAVPLNTPVKSPASGKVVSVYSNSAGGKQLVVKHNNGYYTGYAHLNSVAYPVGTTVSKNQIIAHTGNTGNSTGPHLHLTLKNKEKKYLNPLKYLS